MEPIHNSWRQTIAEGRDVNLSIMEPIHNYRRCTVAYLFGCKPKHYGANSQLEMKYLCSLIAM